MFLRDAVKGSDDRKFRGSKKYKQSTNLHVSKSELLGIFKVVLLHPSVLGYLTTFTD